MDVLRALAKNIVLSPLCLHTLGLRPLTLWRICFRQMHNRSKRFPTSCSASELVFPKAAQGQNQTPRVTGPILTNRSCRNICLGVVPMQRTSHTALKHKNSTASIRLNHMISNHLGRPVDQGIKPSPLELYAECSDSMTELDMSNGFLLYENFVSEAEEQAIVEEIEPYLKRLKYEYDHWDDAIHGYRETERKHWSEKNKVVIQRIKDLAFPEGAPHLAYVHVLDIEKNGYIKAHVDSVRFCGDIIAGISLLSTAVMRLVHTENKDRYADVLVKQRSLYVMKDTIRYKFTHEVLGEEQSQFRRQQIPRDRRISVICRCEPNEESE